ncbi:hypothetical protein [Kitasatospora sp. NPDC094016]|uniref:hypothetical protein n=1 Tax=Kitasatospora sp. NPDC094016 TaxID=3154986 RepID=UPI00332456E2
MSGRYGIVPADALPGVSYPVWVIQDHKASQLVKTLPPRPEPLRFYTRAAAEAYLRFTPDNAL